MAVPFAGTRKFDEAIEPSAARGPVIVAGSVLSRVQVPPMFQELPVAVEEPSATALALPTARFAVSFAVEPPSKSKPDFAFWYAVLRFTVMVPVFPLSVNPCAALPNDMLLLTAW